MHIHVDNLTLGYDGHTLFENISFEVCSGPIICIDGPSGCGKSSLLRAMLGFVRPQRGTISIDDTPVDEKTAWQLRHNIAYVTQEPDMGRQGVLDCIQRPFGYKANIHLRWSQETVNEWFDRFNLPHKLFQKQTSDLSGGEKQRIAIITALLLERPILLLDEPTSALDKQSKRILREVLTGLQKTIVFISHEDVLTDIANETVRLAPAEGAAMDNAPIQVWGLVAGYGLLIIPLAILLWARVPLVGKMLFGAIRMTVQLLLVGFYLQIVFDLNNPWLNATWVLVMITVADISVIRGAGMQLRKLALPLFVSLLIGISIPLLYFLGIILQLPNLLEARFVIPIGGMILGNCLRANIIGIRSFYQSIRQGEKAFCQQLADGATLAEATRPYMQHTLEEALAPTLATMATIGLVSLPGMMTGVILGGSDPRVAVMYQIAIMIAIFTGTSITILLGILSTRWVSFDDFGMLKKDIFKT